MKVYAIYNQENKFIAAFPDREDAINYGIVMFGKECGWEYDIKEMCLVHQLLTSTPYTQPLQPIPCTPVKPPYSPNIWCGDGTGPKATFTEEGPLGPTGIPGPLGQVVSHSSPVDSGPFAPGTK